MSHLDLLQLVIYLGIVLILVKPLGWYIAQIYSGKIWGRDLLNNPIEKFFYKLCGIDPQQEMSWREYATALLMLNLVSWLSIYVLFRIQAYLPLNPQAMPDVAQDLSFNSAASFASNTGWQAYGGETTLSYISQMLSITLQGFLSAATSMCVLMALIRGLVRRETTKLGNFWVDALRSIIYIFLPIAVVYAVALSQQGVIQNFNAYVQVNLIDPFMSTNGPNVEYTTQTLPMGPVASLVAIKQISSIGAGFFNTNSCHPFANPSSVSNLLEMIGLILIPAALCYTFGYLIKQRGHGWMLLSAILIIFIPCTYLTMLAEQMGNPVFDMLGTFQQSNFEGKDLRIGIIDSAIWSATTAASANGSVNCMMDSLMPQSNFLVLLLMHFGEVIFGGVGCGLYGLIFLDIIAVFIAGLMIGRTPEYLGKKIDPYEMKIISLVTLMFPLIILLVSAYTCVTDIGRNSILNPGPHGLSEIIYAFTSVFYNNGSAFAGLNVNTAFYNITIGFTMLISRYWTVIAVLALAGSMARKRYVPASIASLSTHNLTFTVLLVCVIVFMGGLTFFPTLSLGPIVEFLSLWRSYAII